MRIISGSKHPIVDCVFNTIIHDISNRDKSSLHNRFDCKTDPKIWKAAIELIKTKK